MNTIKRKMRIKVGDTVQVLRGKDGPKARPDAARGEVIQVFPERDLVVVDGVNKAVRHMRSQQKNEKGQRVEYFAPMHVSKVMLVCPKCQKTTRVGYHITEGEDGKKLKSRQCKKCEATF
jgi:large subunit ribosomal protein L24